MNNIKKEVKEKIAEYSNEDYFDDYIKHEFLTDEGDANIYIQLENKDKLFDSRTIDHQLELCHDIYAFLDEKSSMLNSDIQLNFHILGLNLDEHEKKFVCHLIKEHYAIELYKKQKEYKRFRDKIFKLVVLGILFVICYILTSIYLKSNFFKEVFGFLFSFALWEAFDCLIYDFSEIKLEREAITQKLLIDIYFSKENID